VKKIIRDCQKCKNQRAIPQTPEMAPLPIQRLAVYEHPFTYTGLDFFGPVLVSIGRRHEKRYGALFTCLTTRAVHLELAASLTTDSCIIVVRNFINRRGLPKEIWSDNGTNMHGAESELKRAIRELDQNKLQTDCQMKIPGDIITDWKFITPRAPHMGGAWERMVKSVKNVIYSCMKEKVPTEEILRSFLIEAESIVNSRPLTYQSTDEKQEALTPNHFLRMAGKIIYSPGYFDEKVLRKSWRCVQQMSDEFWKRFVREYLPHITKRTKWYIDQKPIEIGNVVIIVDENAPRNVWQKGIITKIHPGKDGKVRTVTVKTNYSEKKRPVAKLAVLNVKNGNSP
jgi:hypothetical protein